MTMQTQIGRAANPPADVLPLSSLAITAWTHGITPDQLDAMAAAMRQTANELRAIGEASHV